MTDKPQKAAVDPRIQDILNRRVQSATLKPKVEQAALTAQSTAAAKTAADAQTPEGRENLVTKFIETDLGDVIAAGKKLLSPPFEIAEPLEFVRVASKAVQDAFGMYIGVDRRIILMDLIQYLKDGPLKAQMGQFGWLLNEGLLGFVYDFFVKMKPK